MILHNLKMILLDKQFFNSHFFHTPSILNTQNLKTRHTAQQLSTKHPSTIALLPKSNFEAIVRTCARYILAVDHHRFSPIYHQNRPSNRLSTMKYATLGHSQERNRACTPAIRAQSEYRIPCWTFFEGAEYPNFANCGLCGLRRSTKVHSSRKSPPKNSPPLHSP